MKKRSFFFGYVGVCGSLKKFHYFLTDSVIPFIRLNKFKAFLKEQAAIAFNQQQQYQKSIKTLQQLQALENNYKQNLQLIQKAKKMVF